jgi:hypothetical protein
MKKIIALILLGTSLSSMARELYPEEFLKLPSKSYNLELLKDIKMKDGRNQIIFHNGEIVSKLPIIQNRFHCTLENARRDSTIITLEKGNIFRFSGEDGFQWDHYVTGRIWRKRLLIWDNDDVQTFSCDDTPAFSNEIQSEGVIYKNIKKAVGKYLKITINEN